MQLARVTGTVVATIKVAGLQGVKLLMIQPLDRQLQPVGGQLVAADAVHMAGPGELVYFVSAREAAQAMPDPFVPVDHAIVGIVDAVRSLAGDDPAMGLPATGQPAGPPAGPAGLLQGPAAGSVPGPVPAEPSAAPPPGSAPERPARPRARRPRR
jgi:ethanolamine utilization protein EutN